MLTVITGCMFAGKTSTLISLCTSHVIAGDSVIVFKPTIDNRYDDKYIVSHNLDKFSCVPIECSPSYKVIKDNIVGKNIVCFDEVQFFSANIFVDLLDELFKLPLRRIICAGLPLDALGRPFGVMPELLCNADEIIQLKAVCSKCKGVNVASRTYKKGKQVWADNPIDVGGIDKYEARCFNCWRSD